jgi:hypothetical protein
LFGAFEGHILRNQREGSGGKPLASEVGARTSLKELKEPNDAHESDFIRLVFCRLPDGSHCPA